MSTLAGGPWHLKLYAISERFYIPALQKPTAPGC